MKLKYLEVLTAQAAARPYWLVEDIEQALEKREGSDVQIALILMTIPNYKQI